MPTPATPLLIATVTAVFDADATGGGSADDVATALLAHEEVCTVRIGAHGARSVYRVDVAGPADERTADRVAEVARDVASELGLTVQVDAVGLVREEDRVELFHRGPRTDPVWGGCATEQAEEERSS